MGIESGGLGLGFQRLKRGVEGLAVIRAYGERSPVCSFFLDAFVLLSFDRLPPLTPLTPLVPVDPFPFLRRLSRFWDLLGLLDKGASSASLFAPALPDFDIFQVRKQSVWDLVHVIGD